MAFLGSRFNIIVLFLVLVCAGPARVRARIPAHTQVALISIAVCLVGVATGFAIYHFAYRSKSRTGRTASISGALTLTDTSHGKTLTLVGQTGGLKTGERIRVNGKQLKPGAALFLVEKIRKEYGVCSANPQANHAKV